MATPTLWSCCKGLPFPSVVVFNKFAYCVLAFLFCALSNGMGQVDSTYAPLWHEARTDVNGLDIGYDFDRFIALVERTYPDRPELRAKAAYFGMFSLELEVNLVEALHVADYILAQAEHTNDKRLEADVIRDKYRYYSALGNQEEALRYLEKSNVLWAELGETSVLIRNEMVLLEMKASVEPLDTVYGMMQELLARAKALDDVHIWEYMNTRMVNFALELGDEKAALQHLDALAALPVSDPIQPSEFGYIIIHARGRAKLAELRGNTMQAMDWYRETIRLCKAEPSRWLQSMSYIEMASLLTESDHTQQAKLYLDTAQWIAEEKDIYELLMDVFTVRSQVAEQEGNYPLAMDYLRKSYDYRDLYEARASGFDRKNYLLEQEKEALALEKQMKELALQTKDLQFKSSLGLAAFVFALGLLVTYGFITQRRRRRQLARQNTIIRDQADQLKEVDALKSRLFANVSHELRTPLSLILGPLRSIARENGLSGRQKVMLGTAQQAADQMNGLVNDILDLSKMDAGRLELELQQTPLYNLLYRTTIPFQRLIDNRKQKLITDFESLKGYQATLDRRKVQQILNNLLSNAVKFTGQGGRIHVKGFVEEQNLQLTISDQGIGIAPEDASLVFDRYFQSKDPGRSSTGGTGIGLALSKEYAELMDGELILVGSEIGQGSVFRLTIPLPGLTQIASSPLKIRALRGQSSDGVKAVAESHGQPQVLVVEDNLDFSNYLKLLLTEDYTVHTASNGQEALDWMQQSGFPLPDLIISDLMMPIMDGQVFLETVKRNPHTAGIPFIMLTARADARSKLNALQVGVDDYLVQPFDEEELLARMVSLLRNQRVRVKHAKEEEVKIGQQETDAAISHDDRSWLDDFQHYVGQQVNEGTLSVPQLAEHFGMSESTLLRQLKRLTGLTPVKYVQEMRLDIARGMLENELEKPIQQIASEVGYQDVRSFSRIFKKRYGKSPSAYRKE